MTVTASYLRMVSYNTLSYAYINTCNSNERVCMTTSVRSRYQELMANNTHLLGVTRHLAPHKLDWITTTIRQAKEAVQLTHTCDVYVACASAEYYVTVTVSAITPAGSEKQLVWPNSHPWAHGLIKHASHHQTAQSHDHTFVAHM